MSQIRPSTQLAQDGFAADQVMGWNGSQHWPAVAVAPTGKTGATNASRYVGGTTTGHPTSGTFAAGDFVVTADGHIWVCSASGTPGTWVDVGGTSSSGYATVQDEGSPLTARTIIDFAGAGVTATDDAANSRTLVTIPGATAAFHGVKVYRNAAQSVPVTTFTAMSWDGEAWDTDAFHDPTTNPDRVTWPSALGTGHVSVKANVTFSSVGLAAGKAVELQLYKNGSSIAYAFIPFNAADTLAIPLNVDIAITTGDYLQLMAWQNNTGAISTNGGGGELWTWMSVTLLG